MKQFTFPASCIVGKGYSGECYVEVDLSNEEAERLIEYGTKSDVYLNGFDECEELEDIYNKVYEIAVEQMTEELEEAGEVDLGGDPVDSLYPCIVKFPEEFEDMLEDEDD